MSSLRCWRCLPPTSAPLLLSTPRIPTIASVTSATSTTHSTHSTSHSFSTTPSQNAVFDKIVAKKGVHRVGGKHMQIGKDKEKRTNLSKVKPGERKAFRKRVTLSNTNALPVHLDTIDQTGSSNPENVGKVLALGDDILDKLRTANAFKATQSWNLFRQPAMLVRKETVELCSRIDEKIKEKQVLRCVITGNKVSGKSMVVLQVLAHAYLNGWIVLNIPEGQDLVNSHTDYAPGGDGSPMWAQPSTMQHMCRQLSSNNSRILAKLQVSKQHPALGSLQVSGMSLNALANAGKDPEDAWNVWTALWYELTEVPDRPPIIFCLDGLSHIMKMSEYKTKEFEPIHAHDLAVIRAFCDLLAGKTVPSGGGAVIGAMSMSNCPKVKSVDYAVAYKEALLAADKALPGPDQQGGGGDQLPQREPYCRKYDARVDDVLRDVEIIRVSGVDRKEARAIMEYWAASGVYRHAVDDRRIAETWSLGGHGILGEMERASLKYSRV